MSDLSDFGGGVEHNPEKEDQIRLDLSKWIRNAGADVYWAEDHDYGWGTFSVTTRRRPDLVIDGEQRTYAVEIKPAEDSATIHDGFMQLVRYWKDLVNNDVVYKIGGKRTDIDAVIIGTDMAPSGSLYEQTQTGDVLGEGRTDEGQIRAVEVGQIPEREFNATERAIRVSWRLSKEQHPDATTGIGVLLSSRLDGDEPGTNTATPAALFKSHAGQQPKGWSSPRYQWWEYIPFYHRD